MSIQSKIYARCLLGAFTVAGYIVSKCKISSKIQLVHKILVNKGMRPIRSITYSILDISAIICQKHRILDATMTAQDWTEKGMWSKLWYAPGPPFEIGNWLVPVGVPGAYQASVHKATCFASCTKTTDCMVLKIHEVIVENL